MFTCVIKGMFIILNLGDAVLPKITFNTNDRLKAFNTVFNLFLQLISLRPKLKQQVISSSADFFKILSKSNSHYSTRSHDVSS